ncbi:tRNA (adenosine(37)-N6)-threonylcarbamoyltransferase complex dimerization subunit type 1 TsaB [Simiduia curdlanivorans]|uniref:tRNA threonylcarbamoyladenosine biosynthesis protein TsaB n=1 Tax=Simiduia curdlanivorans TaxID=1492769 RepID=A0ABV8VA57_9GAMM|nr:tRNA (adenosine(37)-N6)-threonylcarbamoyltransferase complex dimerization subunit type 1 TsaB [Simiduia curdlanivorans]MDN3639597.1 tRNA (adenosine(37)-N6)-threonylcarbamoyltransferase complex dimerization subunit type 1 TsaB [Simiduia curdlanivorans]
MANYLALDTSSNACSVALCLGETRFQQFELAPRGHMQRLLPMVDSVLAQAGISLTQLDGIAFGCGPGSFTGLRVATGVVQGMAYAIDLPVIPISSLAVLAQGFARRHPNFTGVLGVAVDARMDEVYAARYRIEKQVAQVVGDEAVIAVTQVMQEVLATIDAGCGSGWGLEPLRQQCPTALIVDVEPDAQDLLDLVLTGAYPAVGAAAARPVYLRNSITWQKRQRIRSASL